MNVLFIYPNLYTQMGFNHGLASLSAVLKQAGHETRMLNLNENLPPTPSFDDIVEHIREWQPGLIGFSCLTMQYEAATQIANALRTRAEQEGIDLPPLVVGGIHCTMVPQEVMNDGVWDHVGVGECEDRLLELVDRVEQGQTPDDIQNFLSWKGGLRPAAAKQPGEHLAELWVENAVGEFPDFNELPRPDYELFDTGRITDHKNGWFSLMSSRGCPYRCTYCLNHRVVDRYKEDLGRPVSKLGFLRYKESERMIDEVRWILNRYPNVNTFILDDDLFTMNPEHAIAFCDAYEAAGIEVPIVVNSHVKRLDPRVAEALSRARCKILKLGIESGCPRVRSEVLKRFMSQRDILETVRVAEEHGLHTSGFLMIGLPTETHEERLQSIELLAQARIGRFRTSFFYPFPGTEGYDMALAAGYVERETIRDISDFTGGSTLDFGPEENLFIDKLGVVMPWFVNARLSAHGEAPASAIYQPWVERVLAMDLDEWRDFKSQTPEIDLVLSKQCVESSYLHYSIRYNASMGVRSDYFLAEEAGFEWVTAAAPPPEPCDAVLPEALTLGRD
ncbi:MAG: anaerobic magnesium-protoporphyrin IX monomethyl ester cyclase [Planctomycetota bacterium]|jgi:anaerobic magnesium-protoporphyrin IX monomethyl ester cyclase